MPTTGMPKGLRTVTHCDYIELAPKLKEGFMVHGDIRFKRDLNDNAFGGATVANLLAKSSIIRITKYVDAERIFEILNVMPHHIPYYNFNYRQDSS